MHHETQKSGGVYQDAEMLMHALKSELRSGDQVVFMSNGGFAGMPDKFYELL